MKKAKNGGRKARNGTSGLVWTVVFIAAFIITSLGVGQCQLLFEKRAVAKMQAAKERELAEIHAKALAIGLNDVAPHIEARHVFITSQENLTSASGDTPVHIMWKKSESEPWRLEGTGLRLGFQTNWLLTAYHVFEERSGMFGCRKIGPKEFTGTEIIHPIISYSYGSQSDDSLVCVIAVGQTNFPVLTFSRSTNMFREYMDGNYTSTICRKPLHLTTRPDKVVMGLFATKVTSSGSHLFFDYIAVPGESGTVACFAGTNCGEYVVLAGAETIPEEMYKAAPEDWKPWLCWEPFKFYGVGAFVRVQKPVVEGKSSNVLPAKG